MQLVNIENGFSLIENDKVVFSHTIDNPAIFIGKGKEKMDIYRGNFDIEDYVIERYPLKNAKVDGNKVLIDCGLFRLDRLEFRWLRLFYVRFPL